MKSQLGKLSSLPLTGEGLTSAKAIQHHSSQMQDLESGETELSIEEKYKVNRSLVIKWKKDKEKIVHAVTEEHKNLKKVRPSVKYMNLFNKLIIKFREARKKGHRVNFNWLLSHARIMYKEETKDSSAI